MYVGDQQRPDEGSEVSKRYSNGLCSNVLPEGVTEGNMRSLFSSKNK